ncbi:MAG: hypothetical protein R3F34_09920 [Planctomycetota bacterium]
MRETLFGSIVAERRLTVLEDGSTVPSVIDLASELVLVRLDVEDATGAPVEGARLRALPRLGEAARRDRLERTTSANAQGPKDQPQFDAYAFDTAVRAGSGRRSTRPQPFVTLLDGPVDVVASAPGYGSALVEDWRGVRRVTLAPIPTVTVELRGADPDDAELLASIQAGVLDPTFTCSSFESLVDGVAVSYAVGARGPMRVVLQRRKQKGFEPLPPYRFTVDGAEVGTSGSVVREAAFELGDAPVVIVVERTR